MLCNRESKGVSMKRKKKTVILFLLALWLLPYCLPNPVAAQEHLSDLDDKGGYMIGDLVVMRPLGIAATAVGAVAYVLSLPFSLSGGNEPEARKKLMGDPANYTFNRPLGEF